MRISAPARESPAAIVRRHLAMQAQDYAGAKWSIGLRSHSLTEAAVEDAIRAGSIARTWPMRGTLHFVASDDLRWMLALLAPRALANAAGRHRQLEIDEHAQVQAAAVLDRILSGGHQLTRAEIFSEFEQSGIRTEGQRGIHLLFCAAQRSQICFGPMRGKQPTFVLLDEWIPSSPPIDHADALAMLASRYLAAHGPATATDLAWWSGLNLTDARTAIDSASDRLAHFTVGKATYWAPLEDPPRANTAGRPHLLPGFDEFLLGYRVRSATLDPEYRERIVPGSNGVFKPTIVADGRVVGLWSRKLTGRTITVTPEWFEPAHGPTTPDLTPAIQRLAAYHGVACDVE